jgi:hypothetical protein
VCARRCRRADGGGGDTNSKGTTGNWREPCGLRCSSARLLPVSYNSPPSESGDWRDRVSPAPFGCVAGVFIGREMAILRWNRRLLLVHMTCVKD